MWAVFGILFLGGYYLVKYFNAFCKEDAANRKNKNRELDMNVWRNSVIDDNLERKFREERKIEGSKRHSEEAIAILREVTGISELRFNPLRKNTDSVWDASLYILMVQNGHLPALDSSRSFGHVEMALGSKLPKEAKIKFLRWVEKQISSTGIYGAKIYYHHIDPVTWFVWKAFVTDYDKAIPISDEKVIEAISENCYL